MAGICEDWPLPDGPCLSPPDGVQLRPLEGADIPCLALVDGGPAWNGDRALWVSYLRDQLAGRRVVRLAVRGDAILGYGTLLWESAYAPFARERIPEINNLVVAHSERGRGIASFLIREFEQQAIAAGRSTVGLGVGLYADYGPAQRLYVRLGFRPDGRGVTYAHQPVTPGQSVRLDDDLVLWLTKALAEAPSGAVSRFNRS